ncbi:MAG TPA: AbrB/MazE/SpoVT family DNA-binding domain-containing protein [Nitrospirae bacterium]|nr:AbrB/MazE/SpoVT family DNA-binding domain-containing protein [Nitrospirota bacterium]
MSTVKTKVIKIGNSRGIRIPKAILDQYHINDEIELETKNDCLIIKSSHTAREGWDIAFQKMHKDQEDVIIIDDNIKNEFDEKEWEW